MAMKDLGNLIHNVRKQKKITQNVLSKKTDISQGQLSKIENAEVDSIDLLSAARISKALGIKLDQTVRLLER